MVVLRQFPERLAPLRAVFGFAGIQPCDTKYRRLPEALLGPALKLNDFMTAGPSGNAAQTSSSVAQ
jgi:hypothetical protein